MIHARTVDTITHIQDRWALSPDDIFIYSGAGIPECFNAPVDYAMRKGYQHIFILEEDVALDDDTLEKLEIAHMHVTQGSKVVAADYYLDNKVKCAKLINGVQLTGTGAMIIHREVFEKLGKPYFRTDTKYGDDLKPIKMNTEYGGQDIDFCIRAHNAGYPVHLVEGMAEHYHVREYGQPKVNSGAHTIEKL